MRLLLPVQKVDNATSIAFFLNFFFLKKKNWFPFQDIKGRTGIIIDYPIVV